MFTFRMPQTKIRLGFCLPLVLVPLLAHAATTTLTIQITSPPSVSVTCGTATAYTLTAPVKAGTIVCPLAVQPAAWVGTYALTVTGPQPNAFVIAGTNIAVGAADVTAPGAYSLSITTVP